MNNIFIILLCFSFALHCVESFAVSPTAAVTAAGSIIKSRDVDNIKKYKRKDCPVCKGTGKYLSGDGIKMVDCGYCEPEKTEPPKVLVHPPATIKQICPNGTCSQPNKVTR